MNFNQENFEKEVAQSPEIVAVVFWAAWCGHCMDYLDMVEKVATEEGLKSGRVNVDENHELTLNSGVKMIPTLLFFKQGKVVNSVLGMRPEIELRRIIQMEAHE